MKTIFSNLFKMKPGIKQKLYSIKNKQESISRKEFIEDNNKIKRILSPPLLYSIQRNKLARERKYRTKWCLIGGLIIMTLVSITLALTGEPDDRAANKFEFSKLSDLPTNSKSSDDKFVSSEANKPNLLMANKMMKDKLNTDVLEMSSNNNMPTLLTLARQDSTSSLNPAPFSSNQQQATGNSLSIGETQVAPISSAPWLPVEPLIAADSKKKKMMKKKKKMEKKHKEWKKKKSHKKKKFQSKKKKGMSSKKKKGN